MIENEIPYIPLMMSHVCLSATVELPLPPGYCLRFFRPGDEVHWAAITASAGEFGNSNAALEYFQEHFNKHYGQLGDRCLLLMDGSGSVAGTATGWFMDEDPSAGRLHWVAIGRQHQGRGLCKPMVTAAMLQMRLLGHKQAMLTTQPGSWKGIKVYLDLGWRPYVDGLAEYQKGWEIVKAFIGKNSI